MAESAAGGWVFHGRENLPGAIGSAIGRGPSTLHCISQAKCDAQLRMTGGGLACAPGDGGHQQHLVSVLKRVLVPSQEADVFFVYVHIQEAANFS